MTVTLKVDVARVAAVALVVACQGKQSLGGTPAASGGRHSRVASVTYPVDDSPGQEWLDRWGWRRRSARG